MKLPVVKPPATRRPRLSVADQRRRTEELDSIRLQRRLTGEEQAEADRLGDAAHQRVWRAQFAERFGSPYHRAAR